MRNAATRKCTERFLKAMDEIVKENNLSHNQFSLELRHKPTNIASLRSTERDVTLDMLLAVVEKWNVSPEYLLEGKEPMFKREINLDGLVDIFARAVLRRNSVSQIANKAKVHKNNKKHRSKA